MLNIDSGYETLSDAQKAYVQSKKFQKLSLSIQIVVLRQMVRKRAFELGHVCELEKEHLDP